MEWKALIEADPLVCHGQARVKGTRIMVSVVLDNLANGVSEPDLLRSYPSLTPEAIKACVAYGAELARERLIAAPAA